MWDWYNRPGGIRRVPTWKVALFLALAAVISTVVIWLIYSALAPFLFRPIPR
jgi:hypothetical protein